MSKLFGTAILITGLAVPVQGGQPISESMVQCGALYAVAAEWVSEGEAQQRLIRMAGVWEDAAYTRAHGEGRAVAGAWVAETWRGKCNYWADKGALYVFTQDFRDWTSYCRALARHEGLDIDPG
ncbi:hypothetical protein [Roseobacter sp. S98]|uniref:hypothetical protein n=1 Tax=Roseobacter algicola (ex Choi et al. 2025) (nom. illeg.) TaxID=3092138 RepID=UPI0035C7603E